MIDAREVNSKTNGDVTSMKAKDTSKVKEVNELAGYVPTSVVCEMIGKAIAQHEGKPYTEPYAQSTVNSLPFRYDYVEAIKIAGIVLFKKETIEPYIKELLARMDKEKANKEKREANQKRIQAMKQVEKLVTQAIAQGKEIDVTKLLS